MDEMKYLNNIGFSKHKHSKIKIMYLSWKKIEIIMILKENILKKRILIL